MKRFVGMRLALVAGVAFGGMALMAAPPAKVAPPKPAGLTAAVVATKDTYTLDPAQSGKEFRDRVALNKGAAPATPAVDLILRVTNPTEQDISVQIGGDQSQITLNLAGPGAVTIAPNVMMTMDYRIGKPVTIAAGKTFDIAITSLSAGSRGISQCSYWTEPGDYTLSATLHTQTPDEKQVEITSEAVKIKVVKG